PGDQHIARRHRIGGDDLHMLRKLRVRPADLRGDAVRVMRVQPDRDLRFLPQRRQYLANDGTEFCLPVPGGQGGKRLGETAEQQLRDGLGRCFGDGGHLFPRDAELRGNGRERAARRGGVVRFPFYCRRVIPLPPGRGACCANFSGSKHRLDDLRLGRRRPRRVVEILDEQRKARGGSHRMTSSSLPLPISICPCAASSFASATMPACASSTSRSLTGPSASMSSRSILAARSDRLAKNSSLILSDAPFSAIGSLSFSIARSSICTAGPDRRCRSSKVNISDLMRSADSRLRSSSPLRKRVSAWRSRLLNMSAIISCASRRALRARFDMNSARSVFSTPSSTSFCTASMRSIRMTTSMANVSGSRASTRAA